MGRIGQVVGLNAELPLNLLRKGEILEKCQIHVRTSGATQNVATGSS